MEEQSKGTMPDIDKLEEELNLMQAGVYHLCQCYINSTEWTQAKYWLEHIQKSAAIIFEKEEQLERLRPKTNL